MKYFLGIDGGQSHTTALIADRNGRILGRGHAGACNHTREPGGRERLISAVTKSVSEALADAGLLKTGALSSFKFASAHLAMCGEPEYKVAIVNELLRADHLVVGHDAPGALAGALAGGAGVVVLAGTGSVACGENDDRNFVRVGGHGYMFGDEGSAFGIACDALRVALALEDRGMPAALNAELLMHFKQPNLKAIAEDFYAGTLSRDRLASFAAKVGRLANRKDPAAVEILDVAAEALADLAIACVKRLELQSAKISFGGGVFKSRLLLEAFAGMVLSELPDAKIVHPRFAPEIGALLLAYRQAGKKITSKLLGTLSENQATK
ncbi:MAG: BadF/BadG/BcrA/BcrD ATPase family protein [Acidobacteriota bacterium]|nr:BadF/BadG/BcrA/BcrD ATPase family protein [Acidobacteriota bacterium]